MRRKVFRARGYFAPTFQARGYAVIATVRLYSASPIIEPSSRFHRDSSLLWSR